MTTIFEIKPVHLKLLQKMFVGWQDCETGAPEIDPKRPYGNSDVVQDMHYILTGSYLDEDELEEKGLSYDDELDKLHELYIPLHREMDTVLQIVLHTMSFETGIYEKADYGKSWIKIS